MRLNLLFSNVQTMMYFYLLGLIIKKFIEVHEIKLNLEQNSTELTFSVTTLTPPRGEL